MKPQQVAFLSRSRAAVVIAAIAAATLLTACSTATQPSGPVPAIIYGQLYGHITAPAGRTHVTIQGRAYGDSADALAFAPINGVLGAISIIVPSDSTNYSTQVQSGITQVVYLTLFAQGQVTSGVENSTDTARALRIRLDSLGGTLGHDSIAANFTLP